MIPALIGAGASLLGGLLGGGDKETTSYVDYKRMVREAERAGFNPLTAIRNGGSAGFTNTIHPALGSGAFIADALGQVGTAIASYDPMAEARAKLEDEIRQATLANIQADTAARLRTSVGGVPVSSGKTVEPKIPDLYTPYRDNSVEGGGRIRWFPNADLPELDQMFVPSAGIVAGEAVDAGRVVVGAVSGPGGSPIQRQPVPPLTVGDVYRGVTGWWTEKANASYEDHRKNFN